MANPFVHVELHTKDLAKAKTFYGQLFGWQLQDTPMPGGGGTYTMIGVGEVLTPYDRLPAAEALTRHGLQPLTLGPKEGLALLNGTQCSTALAIHAAQRLQRVFDAAVAVGAMTVDAAKGSDTPFDDRIHEGQYVQS